MKPKILNGANMDIDLTTQKDISWTQDACPWNQVENTSVHRCAVKNISICPHFCGIKYPDRVICSFPGCRIKEDYLKHEK